MLNSALEIFEVLFIDYFHIVFIFMIAFFIYLVIKAGFYNDFKSIKSDKIFILVLLIIAILISIFTRPFLPLIFYDEQVYVLQAQNIIENHKNALCDTMHEGICLDYNLPPHGVGLSPIYSLVYSEDYGRLIINIGMMVLGFYLFNIVLAYIIAFKLYQNRLTARSCSVIYMLLPANIVFSTNVMPATICGTFFGLYLLFLLKKRVEAHFVLVLSSIILTSIRIEYVFLAIPPLFHLTKAMVQRKTDYTKLKHLVYLLVTGIFGAIIAVFCLVYISKKPESSIGLKYLNTSYIHYFYSNISILVLSVLFLFFLTKKLRDREKFFYCIGGIFFLYLGLYSLYNYHGEYRYMLPIGLIFALISAGGLVHVLKRYLKNIYLSMVLFLIFTIPMVNGALAYKSDLTKYECWNRFFIFYERDNLETITGTPDNVYITLPAYLGSKTRIPNYTNFNMDFIDMMKDMDRRLIIVNSEFNSSAQVEYLENKYNVTNIWRQEACHFGLFEVT